MSEPESASRVQTRTKNSNQHPGLAIPKRKRRTPAEMKEAREQEQKEKEERNNLRDDKVRQLAALEDKISEKDAQTAKGTRTAVRPTPRPLKKKTNAIELTAVDDENIKDPDFSDDAVHSGDGSVGAIDDDYESEDPESVATEDEDRPAEKKQKQAKTGVRDAVKALREAASSDKGPRGDSHDNNQKAAAKGTPRVSSFDKSSSGAINNWRQIIDSASQETASTAKASTAKASTTKRSGSTLVASSKRTANGGQNVRKPKPSTLKPLSEPLALIDISDEEWLGGKGSATPAQTQRTEQSVPVKVEDVGAPAPQGGKSRVGQKKFVNDDLPTGCMIANKWRRVFIPTYVSYVAGSKDPWFVDEDVGINAMQEVWDAIYLNPDSSMIIEHTIQVNQAVFSITNQRVYEWRAAFASAALSIVNAFFESSEDFDTDDARIAFAEEQLSNHSFLYQKAEGDDKSTYRGLFHGIIVLQTFATHYTAILGGIKVAALGVAEPQCALAHSITGVERAYTLWRDRSITIESLGRDENNKKKMGKAIIKTMNAATGKESSKEKDFNDLNWGTTTRNYLTSIKNLRVGSFAKIAAKAQDYAKLNRRGADSQATWMGETEIDSRAALVDVSDDEY